MNSIIDKFTLKVFDTANEIAHNSTLSVEEKIIKIIMSLNIEDDNTGKEIIKHVNNPQNIVMHQKQINTIISGITPILTEVFNEGIEKGLFYSPYPKESVEMILIYALNTFDQDKISSIEELNNKISAFIYNLERIFNAPQGTFSFMMQLFN